MTLKDPSFRFNLAEMRDEFIFAERGWEVEVKLIIMKSAIGYGVPVEGFYENETSFICKWSFRLSENSVCFIFFGIELEMYLLFCFLLSGC